MRPGIELWCSQGGYHVHPSPNLEPEIVSFVDKCFEHGVTRLFPAIVRSDYFPRIINFRNEWNYTAPTISDLYRDWHPLDVLTRAAHARDIEVCPYINVNHHGNRMPNWQSPLPSKLALIATSRFASEHPEFWKRARDGRDCFQCNEHVLLSPAFPPVRAYEIGELIHVLDRFDVDGVQLEYTIWPLDETGGSIYGYEEPALKLYHAQTGMSALDVPNDDPTWTDVRASFTTSFVRELRATLKARSKPTRLSASIVACDPQTARRRLQPWDDWVKEELLDDLYLDFKGGDIAAVAELTATARRVVGGHCRLLAEISCYHPGAEMSNEALLAMSQVARQRGADAVGIYRADAVEARNLWESVRQIAQAQGWSR